MIKFKIKRREGSYMTGELLIKGNTGCYHILNSKDCINHNVSEILDFNLDKEKTICITTKSENILFNECGIVNKHQVQENMFDYFVNDKNLTQILWDNLNNKIVFKVS
jgi:hypothetical protein